MSSPTRAPTSEANRRVLDACKLALERYVWNERREARQCNASQTSSILKIWSELANPEKGNSRWEGNLWEELHFLHGTPVVAPMRCKQSVLVDTGHVAVWRHFNLIWRSTDMKEHFLCHFLGSTRNLALWCVAPPVAAHATHGNHITTLKVQTQDNLSVAMMSCGPLQVETWLAETWCP